MKNTQRKAFTLIEILVAIWIFTIFVVVLLSFGVNKALQSTASNRLTYSALNNDINTALRNAMSGYGWKSIWEGIKDEKTLLPEDFIVFFRSSIENDLVSWYYYLLESQKRDFNNINYTRIINKEEIEYETSYMYLKTIRMKTDESDIGTEVQSFAVSFKNPTGKTSFYVNNNAFIEEWNVVLSDNSTYTINEVLTPSENTVYSIAELDFYSNEGKKVFTQKIYKDKRFPISLND